MEAKHKQCSPHVFSFTRCCFPPLSPCIARTATSWTVRAFVPGWGARLACCAGFGQHRPTFLASTGPLPTPCQACPALLRPCRAGKRNRTYTDAVYTVFGRWGFHAIGWIQHVNLVSRLLVCTRV